MAIKYMNKEIRDAIADGTYVTFSWGREDINGDRYRVLGVYDESGTNPLLSEYIEANAHMVSEIELELHRKGYFTSKINDFAHFYAKEGTEPK